MRWSWWPVSERRTPAIKKRRAREVAGEDGANWSINLTCKNEIEKKRREIEKNLPNRKNSQIEAYISKALRIEI